MKLVFALSQLWLALRCDGDMLTPSDSVSTVSWSHDVSLRAHQDTHSQIKLNLEPSLYLGPPGTTHSQVGSGTDVLQSGLFMMIRLHVR